MLQPSPVIISATLVLFVAAASGQDEIPPETSRVRSDEADAATHDAIRAVQDALIKAINERDVETLTSLLHEDIVLTAQDGNKLTTIRKREGVREYVARRLTDPAATVRELTVKPVVDDLTILHGDDTGIAYGSSADLYVMTDGREVDVNTRWSATFVREEDQWQVASLHVSSNLFDNPVISQLSRLITLSGLAAGLGGLMIGYGIARFPGRRKRSTRDRMLG